jgi:hypothetical protein
MTKANNFYQPFDKARQDEFDDTHEELLQAWQKGNYAKAYPSSAEYMKPRVAAHRGIPPKQKKTERAAAERAIMDRRDIALEDPTAPHRLYTKKPHKLNTYVPIMHHRTVAKSRLPREPEKARRSVAFDPDDYEEHQRSQKSAKHVDPLRMHAPEEYGMDNSLNEEIAPAGYNYSLYGTNMRHKQKAHQSDFRHATKLLMQQLPALNELEERNNEYDDDLDNEVELDSTTFFPYYLQNFRGQRGSKKHKMLAGGAIQKLDNRKRYLAELTSKANRHKRQRE